MKNYSLLLLTSLIIISCSDADQKESLESESTASNYVEYVWHSAEENFNAENLATLISKWNTIIDGYPCDMDGANILTPTEKRENHDFVWVLKWPSIDARNSCWDIWTNTYAADWDKTIDGIMSYDSNNAFMFSVKVGRTPKEENTSGSFVNTFYFCKFNEGSNTDTLNAYREDLAKINNFSSNHWYVLLDPTFDPGPSAPDFVWLDLWGSDEDKNTDMKIWEATDLPARAQSMVDCEEFSNYGVVIR